MAQYVTPELQECLDTADAGTDVVVALVPADGASDSLHERARQSDVEIQRRLPSGVILAVAPATVMLEFIDSPDIGSASKPDRAQTLS